MSDAERRPNGLINEKSPYLLQHAHNPVDWRPWSEETFALARREDKPVFLSIGYSTCHWCHVMERESFEDEEAAKALNETFVCVKVDREERPDIDGVYMTVCQAMTGRGGWPLTVVLTPDRRPLFAGTYLPKTGRFGQLGLMELCQRVSELWTSQRNEAEKAAERIAMNFRDLGARHSAQTGPELGEAALRKAYEELSERFDPLHGGFGERPKFPSPHVFLFLLRFWRRSGEEHAKAMVEKSLTAMRLGGLFDHVGFGFHRYSTDQRFLLPHFEKMLYDQAMLVMAYVEAWLATGDPFHERTVREVLEYVLRDMTSPEGGFYCAEDADSEGEEGKFYVWTTDELVAVLGREDADLFGRVFGCVPGGNFADEATGERVAANIPHLRAPLAEIAGELSIPAADLDARLEDIRRRLFTAREACIHPGKDDKVLTDWNGLMIAALAQAARALKDERFEVAACKAADFVLTRLRSPSGDLLHRYRDGEAAIPAMLDDYAFLAWGLVELNQANLDPRWLDEAHALCRVMLERFWDEENGGFYQTAASAADELLFRQKELYDGAMPSGNSAAMLVLIKLARLVGDASLEEKAAQLARAFAAEVAQQPSAFCQLLCGLDFAFGPSFKVLVCGDPERDDAQAFFQAVASTYQPNTLLMLRAPGQEVAAGGLAGFGAPVPEEPDADGKASAQVCRDFNCLPPVRDPQEMLRLLRP